MTDTPVVLINVFKVSPARQQELVDLLTQATEEFVSVAPGFGSARLHRSLDGTKVTMVATWRNEADYRAMRDDAGPRPYLERALAISVFEPGMYDVVRTFLPRATRT